MGLSGLVGRAGEVGRSSSLSQSRSIGGRDFRLPIALTKE